MDKIIEFISYFINEIKGFDYLNEFEITFKEINLLPNIYIAFYIIKKKQVGE